MKIVEQYFLQFFSTIASLSLEFHLFFCYDEPRIRKTYFTFRFHKKNYISKIVEFERF